MSLFESASLVVTPNGTKASKLYAIKPTSGAGDLSVTRATTATRVNSAGLIESVAVNVPRLDYTDSTCPSILVEPQRTNIALYSEQLNNAAWQSNLFGNWSVATVTPNAAIAPDGTMTADNISLTSPISNSLQRILVTANTTYTYTIYIKAPVSQNYNGQLVLRVTTGLSNILINENFQVYNISSLVSTNEWKRFDITFTVPAIGVNQVEIGVTALNSGSINANVLAWGAQLEAGAYGTSYIPTTSASVTRNADVISKTGISSLIGQTEGTVFFDADVTNTTGLQIGTTDGGSDYINSIQIAFGSSSTNVNVFNGGGVQFSNASAVSTGRKKIAIAYKANDFALYINGVQIATDSSGSVPTLSGIFFNHQNLGTTNGRVNLTALWKTRLTNAELAELTTL
jgi:hypothetical protein